MTRLEAIEILEYVANEMIAPICDSDKTANEIFSELTKEKFNDLCRLVYTKVEKED